MNQSDLARQITDFVNSRQDEMLALLEELVLIQSGTANKPGVDRVADHILKTLEPMGLELKRIPQTEVGDILVAQTSATGPGILLVGHMDTVFPADTGFNWFRQEGGRVRGPGSADMKGGLVAGIYALKALKALGLLHDTPVCFIFNPDEEIGSPYSGPVIADYARRSFMAMVLEAAGLGGELVTGRKGRIAFKLVFEGKAGHAAYAGENKASGVLELSRKVLELEALNALAKGVTVNVGRVAGGIGPNTVPKDAWAEVDVRFIGKDEGEAVWERLETICAKPVDDGVSISMQEVHKIPPMEQTAGNRRIQQVAEGIANELGMKAAEQFRPGGSDANGISQVGVPVVDGFGPAGNMDHSEDEYMETKSLYERTILTALTILECTRLEKRGEMFG